MSGGITVKEFKHIPGVNDAEYIKKLEELHEIDKGIISKAVAKIKMLSAQSGRQTGRWIWQKRSYTFDGEKREILVKVCSYCEKPPIAGVESPYCPHCGEKKEGEWNDTGRNDIGIQGKC